MRASDTLAALVQEAGPDELPALAGELARAFLVVMARATASATAPIPIAAVPHPADELLTVEEAALRLNVKVSWLYRHGRSLPFARKLGRRTLRFEARGLERWAATRAKA